MQEIQEAANNIGLIQTSIQLVTSAATGVCIFFLKRLLNEFDALKQKQENLSAGCPLKHAKADAELAEFKLEVAKSYARETTVSRIHARLDDIFKILAKMEAKRETE